MINRAQQLASLVIVLVFIYVVVHRERYHVSRFGLYYGVVALVTLGALYAWSWWGEVERKKAARMLDRQALAQEWCEDFADPSTESKGSPLPPGENR